MNKMTVKNYVALDYDEIDDEVVTSKEKIRKPKNPATYGNKETKQPKHRKKNTLKEYDRDMLGSFDE